MSTEAPPAPTPETTPAPATTPEVTPAPATPAPSQRLFTDDGKFAENWHTHLGDEFAPHAETLSRFKDPAGLAKSYLHARASRPQFPGADATPQQIQEWRELAGVPADPSGYQLQAPETLPEGVSWDDGRVSKFAELAHKYHVHPEFMREAIALDLAHQSEIAGQTKAQIEAHHAAAKEELMTAWGAKFQENSNLVRHLVARLGESAALPEEQVQALANSPAVAKVMLQVNRLISEDAVKTPAGFGDLRSPQQRANDIMTGKDQEWSERYRNGDRDAMELVGKLLQQADQ